MDQMVDDVVDDDDVGHIMCATALLDGKWLACIQPRVMRNMCDGELGSSMRFRRSDE